MFVVAANYLRSDEIKVRLLLHGSNDTWAEAEEELTIADQKNQTLLKREKHLRPDLGVQNEVIWTVRALKVKSGSNFLLVFEHESRGEVLTCRTLDEIPQDAQFLLAIQDKGGADYVVRIFYEKQEKVLELQLDLTGRVLITKEH